MHAHLYTEDDKKTFKKTNKKLKTNKKQQIRKARIDTIYGGKK